MLVGRRHAADAARGEQRGARHVGLLVRLLRHRVEELLDGQPRGRLCRCGAVRLLLDTGARRLGMSARTVEEPSVRRHRRRATEQGDLSVGRDEDRLAPERVREEGACVAVQPLAVGGQTQPLLAWCLVGAEVLFVTRHAEAQHEARAVALVGTRQRCQPEFATVKEPSVGLEGRAPGGIDRVLRVWQAAEAPVQLDSHAPERSATHVGRGPEEDVGASTPEHARCARSQPRHPPRGPGVSRAVSRAGVR